MYLHILRKYMAMYLHILKKSRTFAPRKIHINPLEHVTT